MDITYIVVAAVVFVGALIGYFAKKYVAPSMKENLSMEQRQNLYDLVLLAVKAAEKLCKENMIDKDDRENFVYQFLIDNGITYDEALVKNMIKAICLDLPKTFVGLDDEEVKEKK